MDKRYDKITYFSLSFLKTQSVIVTIIKLIQTIHIWLKFFLQTGCN